MESSNLFDENSQGFMVLLQLYQCYKDQFT